MKPVLRPYEPDGIILEKAFWHRGRFSVIQGPIGSGTSSMCSHKIWVMANEQEPDWDGVRRTRWMVVRNTYPELEKTTIKTWLDWFPPETMGQFRASVPPTHRIRRPHADGKTTVEAEVIFHAVPDKETAEEVGASFELTGFFLNEAQFTDKAVVDELLSRCGRYPSMARGPGATWNGGFGDMNAPQIGHWIPYMRGDIPLPREWDEDEKMAYAKPDDWEFFVQPPGLIEELDDDDRPVYRENPDAENQRWLKVPYMKQKDGKTREWIDRRILNKTGFYNTDKAVYPLYKDLQHLTDRPMVFDSQVPVIVGLDFGRDPSAVIGQCFNGDWRVYRELIGDNEAATDFAPRLKRLLETEFPGATFIFGGDPRGADKNQANNVTAYQVFNNHGMKVIEATSDNNVDLRRETVNTVLRRINGLKISKADCPVLAAGLAGGYHYPKIKGVAGQFADKPRKNRYSHPVEAFENMLIIGGEGSKVMAPAEGARPKPINIGRRKVRLRKYARG